MLHIGVSGLELGEFSTQPVGRKSQTSIANPTSSVGETAGSAPRGGTRHELFLV